MRIKLGLSVALLGLALPFAGGAVCFAQSNLDTSHFGDFGALRGQAPESVLVAAIRLTDFAQEDVQTDENAAYSEASPAADPAVPGPREAGQPQYSQIGIGVKVSTLGAGIEVATPLTR